MNHWQQYLKLLHYLCDIPSFEYINPIAGTRSTHVSLTSEIVQGIGTLPSDKTIQAAIIKKTAIHKETFPSIYLMYQLQIAELNESISFLALPVILDHIDVEARYFNLKPNSDLPILFNTDYLLNESKSEPEWILGEEQKYSDFKHANPPPQTDDWHVWHQYAMQMVKAVTGNGLFDLEQVFSKNTFSKNSTFHFRLDTVLAIYSGSDHSAIRNALHLYDAIFHWDEKSAKKTPLYRAIQAHDTGQSSTAITEKDSLPRDIRAHKNYFFGHMDEQQATDLHRLSDRSLFPLDNSQRLVIEKISQCVDGDVIAVNGPPGSGKTALLKAVIANQWVQAALHQEKCPIILAVGATNQSVTNIISAFPKVPYAGTALPPPTLMHYKRWIPYLNSYGTYYPSVSERTKITEKGRDKELILGNVSAKNVPHVLEWLGEHKAMSTIAELENIKQYYIKMALLHFSQVLEGTLFSIIAACHAKLAEICHDIEDLIEDASPKNLGNIHWLEYVFAFHCSVSLQILKEEQSSTETLHSRKQTRSIAKDLITITSNHRADHESIILDVMRERIFDEKIVLSDLADSAYEALLYDTRILLFERLLDTTLRAEAFHYAARYWEGIYISECEEELLVARTKENVEKGLRRACMLTPCLVSTIHSAPLLFRLIVAKNRFLLGQADLLIMDESGQAPQRIGIPMLALAKKALIVGDVQQLKPVITDMTLGDEAYAYHAFGYSKAQFMKAFSNNLTSMNGSILHLMRLASRFSHQGFGLMLRGHYRCQSNIIQFCNEMVYDNKLMLLPFNSKERGPLPSFSWVHSNYSNTKIDGSRYSTDEAKIIIDFLLSRWESIDHFYKIKDQASQASARSASDLVAIVTPFKAQAKELKRLLKEKLAAVERSKKYTLSGFHLKDVEEMKIGTVDSLQGAEKPIVLFSGVHGALEKGQPYFKDQPFLLNVAVSRAQDCFVAFICEKTYGVNQLMQPEHLPQIQKNSVRYLGYYLGSACKENGVRRCGRLFPKRLVIIEATGKVKTLSAFLGSEYLILDSKGSITEYADETSTFQQLIANGFKPQFQLKPNGVELIKAMNDQLALVDEIILATDDDYVGETIAWHISMQFIHIPKAYHKLTRVRLGAMTKDAVNSAFKIKETQTHDAFIRSLPEHEAIEEQQKFLAKREKIEIKRVKAELFRELIDFIIRDQLAKQPTTIDTKWVAEAVSYGLVSQSFGDANPLVMGRVRAAILSLLAKDVQTKMALIHQNHCHVYLSAANDKILGRIECKNAETQKKTLSKITQYHDTHQTNTYNGKTDLWQLESHQYQVISIPPPDASTMEIIQLSSTQLGIKPKITLQILQALYLGDFS